MSVLAATTTDELGILFILLAIVGFGAAIYCAYIGRYPGAVVAVFVAICCLIFGVD